MSHRSRQHRASRRNRSLKFESLETRRLLALYVLTTGSDSNDGSTDNPWRTLQHAADQVQAGDKVTIRPGTYDGFDVRAKGTSTAPIRFIAEAGVLIDSANSVTGQDGINIEGADFVTVEGFEIIGVSRAGIRVVGLDDDFVQSVTLRGNHAHDNGRWGIFTGFADDLLIEDNETSGSGLEHGIYVSNSGDRPVLRNNVSWNNRGAGIQLNADASLGADGIISQALLEANVIYENGTGGGSAINLDGVQDSVIRNNLLYQNHASGISLFKQDGAEGSRDNQIINNTIHQAADGRWALNIQNGSTGNTVYNNILYNDHGFRGSIDVSANSLSGLVSDYNVIMERFTTDGGDSRLSLSQWQATTGQDTHSLVATPEQLFVDPQAADYHIHENSPAFDSGTATLAPLWDLEELARPQSEAIDIGAYELWVTASNMSIVGRNNAGEIWLAKSDGTSFQNEHWGNWTTNATWKDVSIADVNGDGRDDLVGRANGKWWVARSDGERFVNERWGAWSANADWQDVGVADVNGDGRDDLVGRANGKWWVARSLGDAFVNEQWGAWSVNPQWQDVSVADTNGDGRSDLVGRAKGKWWVARSTGTQFVNERWGAWSDNVSWLDVAVADVNGDGRDDLVGRAGHNGRWWVARSTGSQFVNESWGAWSVNTNWLDVAVADVDNDGRDDLIGRSAKNGKWWVARSSGSQFVTQHWGAWSAQIAWQDVQVADVDGDGRDDVVGRAKGKWWVAHAEDDQFVNERWGAWDDTEWLDVLAGQFHP